MPQFYTMEQLELLKKHIEKLMREMRVQLSRGLVPKSPSAKSSNYTSCTYCDYAAVCGVDFDDVEYRRLGKTKDVFGKLREEYGDE
ncbi:MAG: PD-(D/E)XK nuclease family protein [Clostridia bacterium]|nr:PD-(D/E)XK nuclease family protein [Clostridia bacterium]